MSPHHVDPMSMSALVTPTTHTTVHQPSANAVTGGVTRVYAANNGNLSPLPPTSAAPANSRKRKSPPLPSATPMHNRMGPIDDMGGNGYLPRYHKKVCIAFCTA